MTPRNRRRRTPDAIVDEAFRRYRADVAGRLDAARPSSASLGEVLHAVARLALTALSGFVTMETEPPSRRAERAHDTVELLVVGLGANDGGAP